MKQKSVSPLVKPHDWHIVRIVAIGNLRQKDYKTSLDYIVRCAQEKKKREGRKKREGERERKKGTGKKEGEERKKRKTLTLDATYEIGNIYVHEKHLKNILRAGDSSVIKG